MSAGVTGSVCVPGHMAEVSSAPRGRGPMGGGAGEIGGHSTSYKPCYFGGDLPGQSRAVHTYSSAREVCATVHSKAGEMRRVPPGAE